MLYNWMSAEKQISNCHFVLFGTYVVKLIINRKEMVQFLPMKQILSLGLISVLTGLSQTAGIGGGPIINLCLMLNYQSRISISLTYIFLIGGSLASLWKNATKINKNTGLSFVSLDLILITLPMINSGALLGTMGKNYLSELWVTILFVIIFIYLISEILRNMRKIKSQAVDLDKAPQQIISQRSLPSPNLQPSSTELSQKISETIPVINKLCKPRKFSKSLAVLTLAIVYYLLTVIFSMAKGGVGEDPLLPIASCGFGSLCVVAIHIFISYAITQRMFKWILIERQDGTISDLKDPEMMRMHTIPINEGNKKKLIGAGLSAGVLGATLAIGGAPILIPFWLRAGIDHNVASSTTPALILTSSLASFTISAMNRAYSQTSIWRLILFLAVSFISSALIKDFFVYVAEKYRLKTLVLWLLMIVIIISLIVLVPYQLIKMVQNFDQFTNFGVFC